MRLAQLLILSSSLLFLLCQCSSLDVVEKPRPVIPLAKNASAGIYQTVLKARRLEKRSPSAAISLYLDAAHSAYVSKDASLLPFYNHATGQVIDLLTQQASRNEPLTRSFQINGKTIKLTFTAKDSYGYSISDYDDVIPTDVLQCRGWRTNVKTPGVGAPLVARLHKESLDKNHDESLPYQPAPSGYSYPVTGVIDFSGSETAFTAQIRLLDSTVNSHILFQGKSQPLAKNLTAPLAVSLQADASVHRDGGLGLLGVLEPVRLSDKMGIYSLAPLDTKRIPVILVHGLNSDPVTWKNVINELNADAQLRKNYQFLAFYYPTGLPLRVSSAELKRQINGIYQYYTRQGDRAQAKRMMIIGHSLGGVLTSAQVRRIEPKLWSKAFKNDVKKSLIQKEALRDYQYLIDGPKPDFIKRVVFIATPHRGSRRADAYIIRLLSSLITLPQRMLVLRVPEAAAALTDFGRAVFGAENPANSLTLLRSKSAQLKLISDSPIYPHIRYHSIIGDRGRGDTPNSSDGVVAYQSSHIKGAESELIVPAHHSAHDHPMAIKELKRILTLNLSAR